MKELSVMMAEVEQNNRDKGWYDEERSYEDDIALLHSEVSEMLEAYREFGLTKHLRFTSDDGYSLLPEDDPNAVRWEADGTLGKPEGVASECADVLIRLLDTCGRYQDRFDIDALRPMSVMAAEVQLNFLHSFSAAICSLHEHVTRMWLRPPHASLNGVYESLWRACWFCNVDLYQEYERKMAYNRTRPARHGGKKL